MDVNYLFTRGSNDFTWHKVTQGCELFPVDSYVFIDTKAVPQAGDVIAVETINGVAFKRYHGLRLASVPVNIIGVVQGLAITNIQAWASSAPARQRAVGG
jgi:hypothetical protein